MSERARAWLASVQNVPPDQIAQRATQAAQTGMISFGDAIALKQMADRISGAGQGDAPSPTSVVQDLKQQIQNPQPPQEVDMTRDPRMRAGLATLPAPAMDNAQYAGGGIVAFAAGGTPQYPPEFMAIIEKILEREGGGRVTNIKGDRGGVTKWGISKKSNPDIDVAKLTREDAIKLYYDRYWTKSGADKIAPNDPYAADVLMDTAVHSGPQTAIKLFNEAGGDPAKILDVRQQRLEEQAKQKGQGKFAEGWQNRIEDLRAEAPPPPPPSGTFEGRIDRSKVPPAPSGIPSALPAAPVAPSGTVRGAIDRGTILSPSVPVAPAGLPSIAPQGDKWAGVGVVPPGALPNARPRFLGEAMMPGATPITADEAARYEKTYGKDWRTRYQGMTHPVGMEVTGDTVRSAPATPKKRIGTEYKGPPQHIFPEEPAGFSANRVGNNAPLLGAIDVDAEMKKYGMSKQDRLLALANAGFKMAQAASQPGATFLGSAGAGGAEAVQGLAAINADQRAQRRMLEQARLSREEALAGIRLQERKLNIDEMLGRGNIANTAARNAAAMAAVRLKAEEVLKTDTQAINAQDIMNKKRENAMKYPNSAAAAQYIAAEKVYNMRVQQIMGSIIAEQQNAQVTGQYPGYEAAVQ
jgi:hypothetical protein